MPTVHLRCDLHVHSLGYSCTNCIDDFGVGETPDKSTAAFNALGNLFSTLGLQSSPEEDCPPATSVVFLGIQLDTLAMSTSVTPNHFHKPLYRCSSALSLLHILRHDLQSLLGIMSSATACVRPAHVFMATLLNTLHNHRDSRYCFLSDENKSDICWW